VTVTVKGAHSQQRKTSTGRIGWPTRRGTGRNDGILSTSSLVARCSAAHGRSRRVVAGVAGLAAEPCQWRLVSMCLSTPQATPNMADLEIERAELQKQTQGEHKELAAIYVDRGLDPRLAKPVAEQLMRQ